MASEPDLITAGAFLDELYPPGQAEGYLSFFSMERIGDNVGQRHVDWADLRNVSDALTIIAKRAPTCCVWFGVATRREPLGSKRGGASDCLQVPGFWLDVDTEEGVHKVDAPLPLDTADALELLGDFPVPASVVVHSGGGLQAYWLADRMVDVAEVEPLLPDWHHTWSQRAERRGWHLDNTADVARVMRVPGTFNLKSGTPVPVTILEQA